MNIVIASTFKEYILLKRGDFLLETINKYLCGIIMPIFLILVGIFLIFKLKFFYILRPFKSFKSMLNGGFKPLCLALAGTLGVGNIVGVASAISMGGAGAVFWMWISAIFAMGIKYVEVLLAMRYRKKSKSGYFGGAPYYISEGFKNSLGKRLSNALGCFFALLCVLNSLSTGNLVQVNSVVSLVPLKNYIVGIIFCLLTFFIIIGGSKRINSFTSFLIPFLSFLYIGISLYILIINYTKVPNLFYIIFKDAFSVKSAASGFLGFGIMSAIRYGVSRGILSNEAGCGTSPTAHASSNTNDFHSQGCLGIFEVFVDTILLCTLSALIILLANGSNENAMELVIFSFEVTSGLVGKYIVTICSFLFSFATVICQFYYGAESLKFITKKKAARGVYSLIFAFTIIIGSIIPMSIMWQISDLVIALMTIFNTTCILFLYKN